jgi:CheY-like chemotaxis protein
MRNALAKSRWHTLSSEEAAQAGCSGGPEGNNTRRPGIMIVSSEPLVRSLLRSTFGQYGFRVWVATDCLRALELYRKEVNDIDAVLMDFYICGRPSLGLLATFQQLMADVYYCFLNGSEGPLTDEELLVKGAARVFRKPFLSDDIVHSVRELLQGSRPNTLARERSMASAGFRQAWEGGVPPPLALRGRIGQRWIG